MAIAFDNASTQQTTSATSLTYSYTMGSVSNGMLFVGVWNSGPATPTVTYGGVAMILVKSVVWFFGGGLNMLFALKAPASGANNVVVTYGASQLIISSASSYSGMIQSVTPDATTSTSSSGTTTTLTLTTIADNCWTIAYCGLGNGAVVSAGTGSTLRTGSSVQTGILDSNGVVHPAGSTSQSITIAPAAQFGAVMVSFAPVGGAPTVNSNFLNFF